MLPRTATLVLCLAAAGCADVLTPGVRLLSVEYRQGDEVVLTTYYEDADARPADDVWDHLATTPVMADETPPGLADANDPLRATLDGEVVISVRHGRGAPLRESTARDVALLRTSPSAPLWHLSEADRDRLRP